MEEAIPARELIRLMRRLRQEAVSRASRNDLYATFQSGVASGKDQAADMLEALLTEYGVIVEEDFREQS